MATYKNRGTDAKPAWQARVRIVGYGTKTASGFKTKKEAEDWAAGVERPMRRRTYRDDAKAHQTTLLEALERYEQEVTPAKKGAAEERYVLAAWRRDPLALRSMASITASDVAEWRNRRMTTPRKLKDGTERLPAPSTVANAMNLLSAIFVHAASEWHMPSLNNPVAGVKRPKANAGRKRRLVGDEEGRLLTACKASEFNWLEAMVIIAIETGMRQGELRALIWQHINGPTAYLPDTKNGEPRTVPLSTRARTAFAELRKLYPDAAEVFPFTKGEVIQAFKDACKAAEITGLTFHDLRHEAATRLSKKLHNVLELSAVTGHKTLQTLKRYYQPDPEELAKRLD
ncbi:site-specific integrase [Magnetospirillum sp. 15-1]|uniref:tyrosine-type recombinase/integrase n=1 Tax=Magnetospirillum sp. 15-1 TaxID=1979370 RepID=UPI001144794D|nr:site-specific integrase [Magnetospirillum sp. 15-1]